MAPAEERGMRPADRTWKRLFVFLLFLLLGEPASLHPTPVGGNPFRAGRRRRGERQIDQIDALLFAVALADGFDAAIIIHHDGRNGGIDAQNPRRKRQGEIVIDDREKAARLLFLIEAVDGGLFDQFVQVRRGGDLGCLPLAHAVPFPRLRRRRKWTRKGDSLNWNYFEPRWPR